MNINLGMCAVHLPSPVEAQKDKLEVLFAPTIFNDNEKQLEFEKIRKGVETCSKEGEVVLFISKMFPSDYRDKYEHNNEEGGEEEEESKNANKFVAFSRIFSGTLKRGQKVFVLGPKWNPNHPNLFVQETTAEKIFLMMGRETEPIEEIPAGNIGNFIFLIFLIYFF